MDEHRKERIAGLAFATECLRDDVGRLERLSSRLSDKAQREECNDIAHNISSQLEVVCYEIAELQIGQPKVRDSPVPRM